MVDLKMKALRVLTVITILLSYLIVAGKAEFTVQPLSVERAEELEAVFSCQYQVEGVVVTYDWAINNSIVRADTETVRVRPPLSPDGPATLTILATPQHNNSDVQCVARVLDGFDIVRSELSITATLTVYATIITDVLNATKTITVMWNALPLTEYCVDINKTTLDYTEIVVLDSVCGLANEYIFMYSNPISVCDRFSFTVTPTDGEMRGTTSEPDTGFFTRAKGSVEEPHRIRESGENKSVWFKATIPSCTRFTQYHVDSDLLTIPINLPTTDPLLFDGSLSFSLPTDKMTEYSVTLTDENRIDLVFENIKISTFDVQDLQVSECPGGGDLCLKIEYVEGTLSPGALVCVIRVLSDGELDFASMRLVTIPRSRSESFTIPVPSESYSVIAFDLENSFVPRIPISMAADVENMTMKNMTMATTGGEGSTSPLPSEGISATKLPNGSVEVTCSDSALDCLALFQSTSSVLDGVIVGFIKSTYNSTVLSLNDTFGDGYVVVYSWNSSQSIFEGEVSLIMQLDPPTSAPTTPPTSDPQTDPSPPDMESLPTSVIAGIIGALVVIIILILIILVACCLIKKCERNSKVFHSSNSEGGLILDVGASITFQVALYDVARREHMSLEYNTADTDDTSPPGYDVVRKENLPSPEYETVPSALAGKPTPTTSENPPPLPPPMIQGDSDAPDLPPPYNPAVDNESVVVMLVESSMSQGVEDQSADVEVDESLKRDLSVSNVEHDGTTEEAIGSTESQLEMGHMDPVQGSAEDGASNSADHGGQEAMITAQDVGALITFPIAIYDVARPENMSLECNTADTDDTPPSGYHVVCIENMQAEYETVHVASAKAGKATPTTSENPPPLPPPMIRGDNNDRVLTEKATGSTSQAKDELIEDGGQEAKIAAQHQYMLVEPKPSSSDVKVKDSSKVIYSEVDKDQLVPVVLPPVAKTQGQYIPVETKPASSDAKVMDSTKVVYVQVDKDKLKPVDLKDPPVLPPRRPVTNTGELHTVKTLALAP